MKGTQSILKSMLDHVVEKQAVFELALYSIFSPPEKTDIAIQSVNQQIEELSLRILDCDRLEALCR